MEFYRTFLTLTKKLQRVKHVVRRKRRNRKSITQNSYARKAVLAEHEEEARKLALSRLEHFNQFYNFKYNTVRVKYQKTRWGSCSSKGNLNFNCKIATLSPQLLDYIIVHELCHLGQFNHSQKFWYLVEQQMPDYQKLRAELKLIRL